MRRTLLVLGFVLVALGSCGAWLEGPYSKQVNASIRTRRVSAAVAQRHRDEGAFPRVLEDRDSWGRPFGYFVRGDCVVLVSYGDDGAPDVTDYGPALCDSPPRRTSSCWWPTLDTVFVNGTPVQSCSK